jgi:hypothetical protein
MEENNGKKPRIQPRNHLTDPRATHNVCGFWYAEEEVEDVKRQIEEDRAEFNRKGREEWLKRPQGKLCLEFYEKFLEYKKYLDEHPNAWRRPDGPAVDFPEHKLFEQGLRMMSDYKRERAERDRKNLEKAHLAARCKHRHTDGERCGSPRIKGTDLCYMHTRLEEAKAVKLDLGPMEDPDSIQVAIKKLQAAVIDGTLDHKQVSQLAYLIQLAAWNVTRTTTAAREMEEVA